MAGRQLVAAIVTVLALGGCADDSYESVSKEIDQLMTQGIFLSEEDKTRITALRNQAEQLQQAGKADESVSALKQARKIIETAKDADLLRKSEG
jgi:polyhydroxyalkanoate synthesis regulator phasin